MISSAFLGAFAEEYHALTGDPAFAPTGEIAESGRRLARMLNDLEDRIRQLEEGQ